MGYNASFNSKIHALFELSTLYRNLHELSRSTCVIMKICFLLKDLHLAGGVNVVLSHAQQLRSAGVDVTIFVKELAEGPTFSQEDLGVKIVNFINREKTEPFEVAIATWWESAYDLFDINAKNYAYFVQSIEDRFYSAREPLLRYATEVTYDLPVHFITEASWIKGFLERIRPDSECSLVRNGMDKDLFEIPDRPAQRPDEEPLRVLVEGHPYVPFKGVFEAIEAVRSMEQRAHLTLVSPKKYNPWDFNADQVLFELSQKEMAEVYSDTDVVVKLSRVEGMFGPPLEGFHKGATCCVTPVTGHEEYVVHGHNGVVVDFDDLRGCARQLDLLSSERGYLANLKDNALETARAWPSWKESSAELFSVLQEISTKDGKEGTAQAAQLLRDTQCMLSQAEILRLRTALEENRNIKRRKAYKLLAAFGSAAAFIKRLPWIVIPLPIRRVLGKIKRKVFT